MRTAVAVDLGGSKTAAAVVSADGTLGEVVTVATPAAEGPDAVLDAVARLIRPLLDDDVAGVGVGTAGVVDAATGTIVSSTETFADWVGTDLVTGLRDRLGLGAERAVEVRNDVDAHALGEAWLGAGRGHASMLMVAVGTGVGGGVILPGGLWTGAHRLAGEIGHIPTPGADGLRCACGRLGHLEALAAGPAIERRYAERSGVALSGREIVARAEEGDAVAQDVVRAAATGLGTAIAGMVTLLDPSCVVVGGGVAQSGPVWWDPLRAACRAQLVDLVSDIELLPAELGSHAGLYGAAKAVFDTIHLHTR
ncbi:ROK family protein [Tessaracoccus caeni]|uniref:ROK family protein n=1 Tax=Tessaracoccus caeni TaxID=3031239 RepID=UPI0023DCAC3A|nr:ROK family protein [Tessaracoccus caeni]MDF1487821.1 ROK family protein [Tessaracoccus caeni]